MVVTYVFLQVVFCDPLLSVSRATELPADLEETEAHASGEALANALLQMVRTRVESQAAGIGMRGGPGGMPGGPPPMGMMPPGMMMGGGGPGGPGPGGMMQRPQTLLGRPLPPIVPPADKGGARTMSANSSNKPPMLPGMDPNKVDEVRRTIYVGNLGPATSAEELINHFRSVGDISHIKMSEANASGQANRFAFIEFQNTIMAQRALQLHGQPCGDRPLKVNLSKNAVSKSAMAPGAEAAKRKALKKILAFGLRADGDDGPEDADGGGGGGGGSGKRSSGGARSRSRSRSRSPKRSRRGRTRSRSRSRERDRRSRRD